VPKPKDRTTVKTLMGAFCLLVSMTCGAHTETHTSTSPCYKTRLVLTPRQSANFSTAAASQLESASARILRSYRVGNWYLFYIDTQVAAGAFVFYRGEPSLHRYIALWSDTAASRKQSELRTWARANAPGLPETLARCFAFSVVERRRR
jgi:hypothetical protein